MNITQACSNILRQLKNVVDQLDASQFSQPSEALSHSSIGQHLRHTLEFFISLEQGYQHGVINYDKRAHDRTIERDRDLALLALERIDVFIHMMNMDRPLMLEVNYGMDDVSNETLSTTARRELVYNLEHAVHHMALMKIGIREIAPDTVLPHDFGIATSTLRHHQKSELSKMK